MHHSNVKNVTNVAKKPKAEPQLYCTQCTKLKHLACQKLTKADAKYIIHLNLPWTCNVCFFEILPVNACSMPKREKIHLLKNLNYSALHVMDFLILLKTYAHVNIVSNKYMVNVGTIHLDVLSAVKKLFLDFTHIHMNC